MYQHQMTEDPDHSHVEYESITLMYNSFVLSFPHDFIIFPRSRAANPHLISSMPKAKPMTHLIRCPLKPTRYPRLEPLCT
jgi:hypothetical protein